MASSFRRVKRTVPPVKKPASISPGRLRLTKKWLAGFVIVTVVLPLLLWRFAPANSTFHSSDMPASTASLANDPAISQLLPSPIITSADADAPQTVDIALPASVEDTKANIRRVVDKKIGTDQVTLLLKDEKTGKISTMTRPLGTQVTTSEENGVGSTENYTLKQPDATKDTLKTENIQTIKAGMIAATRDPSTGNTEFKKVTHTFKHTAYEIMRLELADSKTGKVVDRLGGTPEHPFFTPTGMVAMGNLKPEMKVITRRGPPLVVKSIRREHHPEGIQVYNFEVEGDHTYFVGKAEGGTWVHNDCIISSKMHTFDLKNPAWRRTTYSQDGLVYVLRDADTGELLKVGQTTANRIVRRFEPYITAGNRNGRNLAVDVFETPLAQRGQIEGEVRKQLGNLGPLSWDNTGQRLGRRGSGIP